MIKGIWAWPNRFYDLGAEKVVGYLSRAGFTDIFFLTKGLSGKTSFIGKNAPSAFDADVLKELIDASHKKGIRVHAWFTSASDEHYKKVHPESGRSHYKRGKDRELISFKDEDYLTYMKNVITEVLNGYDVDGIHLDYIRYNHMLYGWDEDDISAYKEMGADIDELKYYIDKTFFSEDADKDTCIFEAYRNGNRTLHAFHEARKRDVTKFAKELCETARSVRPDIDLSCAVMPEGAYEDSSFADLHYGQSYQELSKMVSCLLPMAYSKAYDKDSKWVKYVSDCMLESQYKTIMGLQSYDIMDGKSLSDDFEAISGLPLDGYCFFREGATAVAFIENDRIVIHNALEEKITRIVFHSKNESVQHTMNLSSNEEMSLPMTDDIKCIQAFSEDKELCIFYSR